MISIDGLTVEFSGTTLFKDISFTIGDKDRIALMGKNGAGKSTLLKIIAGVRSATRGRVTVGEGGKVGYLPQHLQVEDGRTLVEEASRAFEHLFEIERRIAALNEQLTTRTDYESESYMRLIEEVTAISEKFYAVDLTNYQEDVERILLGLGFERSDFTRQTSEFSGGWRMRIELAKLLLQKPDLLLLDEPTNHLDIESIEWLEDFLMNFPGTLIVVSHDRWFLNNICTHIVDIDFNQVKLYVGNYDFWYESSKMMQSLMNDQKKRREDKIKELQAFIQRFSSNKSKAKQATSRRKLLDQLTIEQMPASSRRYPWVCFTPEREAGKDILQVSNLNYTQDGVQLLTLVEQEKPQLVFLDVEMPGKTGVECARVIQDMNPAIVLIFATAHDEYMGDAFEVYAFDYLLKPFKKERVMQTLERAKKPTAKRPCPCIPRPTRSAGG